MAQTIKNPKVLQRKAKSHTVLDRGNNVFTVISGNTGREYTVTVRYDSGAVCSCDWGIYRPASGGYRSACSHVLAVYAFVEQQYGRKISAWIDPAQAERQHRPQHSIGDGVVLTSRKMATGGVA